MKYNTKIEFKKDALLKRIEYLINKGATIELKEIKSKRSIPANALYWLWLTCIEPETGNSKEDLHQYFKMKYLGTETVNILGEEILEKQMNTKQLNISNIPNV